MEFLKLCVFTTAHSMTQRNSPSLPESVNLNMSQAVPSMSSRTVKQKGRFKLQRMCSEKRITLPRHYKHIGPNPWKGENRPPSCCLDTRSKLMFCLPDSLKISLARSRRIETRRSPDARHRVKKLTPLQEKIWVRDEQRPATIRNNASGGQPRSYEFQSRPKRLDTSDELCYVFVLILLSICLF